MTQIHTDDHFDDEVFRAIAASEGDSHAVVGEEHEAADAEAVEPSVAEESGRPELPIEPEPKPIKRLSVREAASQIDQRIQALAEWLDHLEGVEPVCAREPEPDSEGQRMSVQIVRDTDAGWRVEVSVSSGDHESDWGPATDRPIMHRMRVLRLCQSILKDVVDQQRQLILELRSAVKDFDSSAASLGVKIAR